jgi:LytS/YehU family sensor histidine kinase
MAAAPPTSAHDDPFFFTVNVIVRALLAFLLAGGLALRGWRREIDGLAALERERALAAAQAARREAELRLSVLAAQVEPHFLFNTLAGVRSAIATDPARASDMIDRLVDYLRASIPRLRGDQAAQATVGAQFEIVRAYLALMASRMPRLAFELEADAELRQARFPPLMLISLAENAVKHGVEMKIGPARVTLRAARTDDGRLAVTVEDDGVGFGASAAGSGLGLTNIRERLAQLYGDAATLVLKARVGGGVAATITVPLENAP